MFVNCAYSSLFCYPWSVTRIWRRILMKILWTWFNFAFIELIFFYFTSKWNQNFRNHKIVKFERDLLSDSGTKSLCCMASNWISLTKSCRASRSSSCSRIISWESKSENLFFITLLKRKKRSRIEDTENVVIVLREPRRVFRTFEKEQRKRIFGQSLVWL